MRLNETPSFFFKRFSTLSNFQKVSGAVVVAATVYALIAHSWLLLLVSSLYYIIPVSILAVIGTLVWSVIAERKRPTKADVVFALSSAFVVVIVIFMYYCVWILLKDIYLWVASPQTPVVQSVPIVMIVTLGLGLLLFWFRLRYRSIYGLSEIVVGLALAIQKTVAESTADTKTSYFVALLTACIYLVVRGLDNFHQGLTKDPIDPYGTKWWNRLKAIGNKPKVVGLPDDEQDLYK